MTARIRPLHAGDGPEWQRLFASVAAEGLWIGAETPVPDLGQEMVLRFVGSNTEIMFLALVDDEAVGWISGEAEEDGRDRVGMGIVDGYHGQRHGLGTHGIRDHVGR